MATTKSQTRVQGQRRPLQNPPGFFRVSDPSIFFGVWDGFLGLVRCGLSGLDGPVGKGLGIAPHHLFFDPCLGFCGGITILNPCLGFCRGPHPPPKHLERSVPRLSLRFYSLTPTFVKYDGSTNRKWHRSLWIWLQQVWQRWWAGHFDSIIWIACHFSEDVSTYQEYVAMYQEHVWTHLKKLLQRISTVWQVTVRRGGTCIRKVVQFTYK